MKYPMGFRQSLRLIALQVILTCTLAVFAGAATATSSSAVIAASGKPLDSVFEGLPPSQQVRDTLMFKSKTPGIQNLASLGSLNIGRMLGVGPSANASSCPTGGICANPGTTQELGQRCQDSSGCDLQAHNQTTSEDPCSGVLEQYLCAQCCVDWQQCTLPAAECQEFGGGLNPPDPCLNSATAGPVGEDVSPTCSPIIIDVEGEGFHLTSAGAGVSFDMSGTGNPIEIAWTDAKFHNAFLALPGHDGLVHNGKELFGNFTPQPPSDHPNGFLALAEYDKAANGGNGDGVIDQKDAVFGRLRLWIDENHDGVCQANELHKLEDFGVYSVALSYVESRRTDEFGNAFRYRAKVNVGNLQDARDERLHGEAHEVGRWAWDVFFVNK